MKTFKVLGSGCTKCKTTAQLIIDNAEALGISVKVEKSKTLLKLWRIQLCPHLP